MAPFPCSGSTVRRRALAGTADVLKLCRLSRRRDPAGAGIAPGGAGAVRGWARAQSRRSSARLGAPPLGRVSPSHVRPPRSGPARTRPSWPRSHGSRPVHRAGPRAGSGARSRRPHFASNTGSCEGRDAGACAVSLMRQRGPMSTAPSKVSSDSANAATPTVPLSSPGAGDRSGT